MSAVPPLSGLLLVDKPAGMSSHRVVSIVRRLTGAKVGHAGTLDPMATGLLILLLGSATKLSSLLLEGDKGYFATALLGRETDTLDTSGATLQESPVRVTRIRLEETLAAFSGPIMQIPPMYSAVSIDGARMYKLARKGIEVERPSRPVTIYELELCSFEGNEFEISVVCSKGTYIRSLIADIGHALGCGACMSALRRTRSTGFSLEDTHTLEEVENLGADKLLIPPERILEHLPILTPPDFFMQLLLHGQRVDGVKLGASEVKYRLYGENGFIGLLTRQDEKYGLVWRL
ncbi:tRNA pseudouridine synthase B [bioreactor metagenome]|uniref:tRNA pseudouridine(55) synthase n=1 Tax=bioreactor metagenome TaxID=1076179 RepID=A0A644XIL7_9ZZZZ